MSNFKAILEQLCEEKERPIDKIKKIKQQLKDHAQQRLDREEAGDDLSAHEKFAHEKFREQLLKKLKRAQADFANKF